MPDVHALAAQDAWPCLPPLAILLQSTSDCPATAAPPQARGGLGSFVSGEFLGRIRESQLTSLSKSRVWSQIVLSSTAQEVNPNHSPEPAFALADLKFADIPNGVQALYKMPAEAAWSDDGLQPVEAYGLK